MRSGVGPAGIAISLWPCGHTRCWRSCAQGTYGRRSRCQKKCWCRHHPTVWQHSKRRGAMGPIECPRASPSLVAPRARDQADHWPHSGVVRMATVAPGRGAILSLQTAYSSINYNCSTKKVGNKLKFGENGKEKLNCEGRKRYFPAHQVHSL